MSRALEEKNKKNKRASSSDAGVTIAKAGLTMAALVTHKVFEDRVQETRNQIGASAGGKEMLNILDSVANMFNIAMNQNGNYQEDEDKEPALIISRHR